MKLDNGIIDDDMAHIIQEITIMNLEKLKEAIKEIDKKQESCLNTSWSDAGLAAIALSFSQENEMNNTVSITRLLPSKPENNEKYIYEFKLNFKPKLFSDLKSLKWEPLSANADNYDSVNAIMLYNKDYDLFCSFTNNNEMWLSTKFVGLSENINNFLALKKDKELLRLFKSNGKVRRIKQIK